MIAIFEWSNSVCSEEVFFASNKTAIESLSECSPYCTFHRFLRQSNRILFKSNSRTRRIFLKNEILSTKNHETCLMSFRSTFFSKKTRLISILFMNDMKLIKRSRKVRSSQMSSINWSCRVSFTSVWRKHIMKNSCSLLIISMLCEKSRWSSEKWFFTRVKSIFAIFQRYECSSTDFCEPLE